MFFKKVINKSINRGYEAQFCELCQFQFNPWMFDRIHKCKRCNKYICNNCGDVRMNVIDEEGNLSQQKHRICKSCKYDMDLITQTISKYGMVWQKDSRLAKEWLFNMKKFNQKDYQYQHFLNYFHKSGQKFNQEVQIIEKDVIRGRTDFSVFNYSMKQFFYTIQVSVEDQHTTRLNIANVLYGIAARYQKVGYCQGMSGIAAFLLCFASEETSFIIFSDLIENIIPPKFFQRNSFGVPLIGLMAQIYFLKEYYWQFVAKKKNLILKERQNWFEEDDIEHTKMIIELSGMKALLSIFIGILNFTNIIFVWEELKVHRTFEVVEKAFLAIIYLNRQNIIEERSFKKLQQYFEKLDISVFQQTYHDIDIDQEAKKQLIEEFYIQNQKKCGTTKTGNAYTLSKVTKFSEKQIKQLQKIFCEGFNQNDFTSKGIIDQEKFVRLVQTYYKILKQNSDEDTQILEIEASIISHVFKTSLSEGRQGLLFRQFVTAFSLCTKNSLKDRIVAIVLAVESESKITLQNLYKILKNLMDKVPKSLESMKILFLGRMKNFFCKTKYISQYELNILLNDLFINEMDYHISSECDNIIELVLEDYKRTLEEKEGEKDFQADKKEQE